MTTIIHQTWKDLNVPAKVYPHEWQQSWREHHPDWEYRLWTDKDNAALVSDHYPQFAKAYESINRGVIKSDVARALFLHRHGGMYADLDFVCLRSFTPILSVFGNSIVIGRHANKAQPRPNAWLYSPPGMSFWLKMVEDGLRDWASHARRKTEQVAGPDRLNWCIERYDPERVELPPSFVYPFVWGDTNGTRKAISLDWRNAEALQNAYPSSFAVTRWMHNW